MRIIIIISLSLLLGALTGGGAVWVKTYIKEKKVSDQHHFLESVLNHSAVKITEDNYSCYGEQSKTVGGVIASLLEFNNLQERNLLSYGCYNLVCTMSISDCKPWQESECSSRFLKFELNKEDKINVNTFTCFDMP